MTRETDPDVQLLHGVADAHRFAILRRLAGEGSIPACDLGSCCAVAQPTLSHHLKVLRESGWIRAERRGSRVCYSLEPAAVARFGQIAGALTVGPDAPGEGPGRELAMPRA